MASGLRGVEAVIKMRREEGRKNRKEKERKKVRRED